MSGARARAGELARIQFKTVCFASIWSRLRVPNMQEPFRAFIFEGTVHSPSKQRLCHSRLSLVSGFSRQDPHGQDGPHSHEDWQGLAAQVSLGFFRVQGISSGVIGYSLLEEKETQELCFPGLSVQPWLSQGSVSVSSAAVELMMSRPSWVAGGLQVAACGLSDWKVGHAVRM